MRDCRTVRREVFFLLDSHLQDEERYKIVSWRMLIHEIEIISIIHLDSMISSYECLGSTRTAIGLLGTCHHSSVHVANHYLVCSQKHPLPAPRYAIYIIRKTHLEPSNRTLQYQDPLGPLLTILSESISPIARRFCHPQARQH